MWNPWKKERESAYAVYAHAADAACDAAYAADAAAVDARNAIHAAEKVAAVTEQLEQLSKRVDCVEKYGDHSWEFVERVKRKMEYEDLLQLIAPPSSPGVLSVALHEGPYIYKCNRCGHRRGFQWFELSKVEQDALTTLGLEE